MLAHAAVLEGPGNLPGGGDVLGVLDQPNHPVGAELSMPEVEQQQVDRNALDVEAPAPIAQMWRLGFWPVGAPVGLEVIRHGEAGRLLGRGDPR
eukprot:4820271-Heterocapsa_arctica.AAC.1